jgi:hypothetical protein
LTFSDNLSGVDKIRLSKDGITWDAWQATSTTISYRLKGDEGINYVYYQIRDFAGNLSIVYQDSIILDTNHQ